MRDSIIKPKCIFSQDFKEFKEFKTGVFFVEKEPFEYVAPGGWKNAVEKQIIIGETKILFVTQLIKTETGRWEGKTLITEKHIVPIGIHKSRLIRWETSQLSLFDN